MSANTTLGFLVGVVVGAVASLLLAPKSGADLRADLAREAHERQERLQQQYDRATTEMQGRLDKLETSFQSTLEQARDQLKASGTGGAAQEQS